jgi:hypothetical protein
MLLIKVNFADSDSLITRINATEDEARAYYVGKLFNLGSVDDNMQRCTGIEVLEAI